MHPDRKNFLVTLTTELARSKLDVGSYAVAAKLANILAILQDDGPLGEYYDGVVSAGQNSSEGLLRDNVIDAVIRDPAFRVTRDPPNTLRGTFQDHVQTAKLELLAAAETAVDNRDEHAAADLYGKAGHLAWKYLLQ